MGICWIINIYYNNIIHTVAKEQQPERGRSIAGFGIRRKQRSQPFLVRIRSVNKISSYSQFRGLSKSKTEWVISSLADSRALGEVTTRPEKASSVLCCLRSPFSSSLSEWPTHSISTTSSFLDERTLNLTAQSSLPADFHPFYNSKPVGKPYLIKIN